MSENYKLTTSQNEKNVWNEMKFNFLFALHVMITRDEHFSIHIIAGTMHIMQDLVLVFGLCGLVFF